MFMGDGDHLPSEVVCNLAMEMALLNKQTVDWTLFDVCRCCLKNRCSNDISLETKMSGREEAYADLLRDTLNIEISCQTLGKLTASRGICEECITELQKATAYKRMVLESEKEFVNYVQNLQKSEDSNVIDNSDVEIKYEDFATEDANCDDKSESISTDDEVLAKIKNSRPKKDISKRVRAKYEEYRKKNSEAKLVARSDVQRIIERRGNGPILRQNSLLLLSNSTLCVFQWNQSRYRCFCCQEPFNDIDSLREHNTTHDIETIEKKIITQQNRLVKVEVSNICCKLCNEKIDNLKTLKNHLSTEHDVAFVSKEHLLVPFRLQNGELRCQICLEGFRVFRLLNIHMNKHFQKHVCHICGAGFSNLVFLNLHRFRSHKPFKCQQCDVIFTSKAEKKSHEVSVHGVKFERKLRFPCPYCSERFFQENYRVLHLVEKHGMTKPNYNCNICPKTFITRSLLNNHIKNVHKKERNHPCEVCHNLFYTKSDLTRHKVVHTGEKKYSCNVCKNNFVSKDTLRRHIKRTHGLN
ncbi:zinc finger protein 585B isoform X2 [Manduca sexta]|nr:zinc finger protein 585B isoform X2 [Manduca sexta]